MELAHWFIIAISILPDGNVSVGHGSVLGSFPSKPACEAVLWDEFDRGYSAGYQAIETEGGLQLRLQRSNGSDMMQCVSPWTSRK